MDKGETEIIIQEMVPLTRAQAAALDQLIEKIQGETGFRSSRAMILRCLAACLPLLSVQAKRVRSESTLERALIRALDKLNTAEIETGPEFR